MALGLRFVQVNGLRVHSVWGSERESLVDLSWRVRSLCLNPDDSRVVNPPIYVKSPFDLIETYPLHAHKIRLYSYSSVADECCFVHTLSLDYLTNNILSLFQHVATQISNLP